MTDEKTKGQLLAEEILSDPKTLGETHNGILAEAAEFCEGYKRFLGNKTEREVVEYVLPILREHGVCLA